MSLMKERERERERSENPEEEETRTTITMSDEEYEYEYDEDASENEEMEEAFEYTDEEEEPDDTDIQLENAYYNAKALRETSTKEAMEAFQQVVEREREELNDSYGQWSYKAIKQLVKLHLRQGSHEQMMTEFKRLLTVIGSNVVSPNAVEKGINGMLERVSSGGTNPMARQVYDATLTVFHPKSGSLPNERLWFKTNLKYGQLLYEMNETAKLQVVLKDLLRSSNDGGTSTHLMEIYALQIQLYSRLGDHKQLRDIFNKAMQVRGGIPHPRTLALIQELGGKMHMASREFASAGMSFFQAFKSYDEAGDPSRLRCLKYLVMASMLHASTINPFDSQEARPYRDDPEIVAMTNLVQAFQNNEITKFEAILRRNEGRIMDDEFIRQHVEDLLRTIRMQVLRRVIRPYTRISLAAIAKELNDIPIPDVQSLLVTLILEGTLEGRIDQVDGVLLLKKPQKSKQSSSADDSPGEQLGRMVIGNAPQKELRGTTFEERNHFAMEELRKNLEKLTTQINAVRGKDPQMMRGMVY
mmetsp:Transcript_10906/g.16656  ORF Transcript_10906/g.16656 Transcript_10906/m.16656 type:complete len:528 (-) Transcript_10906:1028-2611(-)